MNVVILFFFIIAFVVLAAISGRIEKKNNQRKKEELAELLYDACYHSCIDALHKPSPQAYDNSIL